MSIHNVGNHASILPSSPQPPEREAGPGGPSHQASSLPLQSLRRASGAMANGLVGAMRQAPALATAALLAVTSEVLAFGAEAARGRPGTPPSRGTPPAHAAAPRGAPPYRGAPPRRTMALPSPETTGLQGPALAGDALHTDPGLVMAAVVGTAVGVGALAVAGTRAYKKWVAAPKATE